MKAKTWRSFAEWPEGVVQFSEIPNVTTDDHYDQELAEGVCTLLQIFGFGADGKIFPIRTWTEEITTASTPDERSK